MRKLVALFGVLGAVLAGCGGAEDGSADPAGVSGDPLVGGCHTVCPKCPANKICPKIACYEECNGKPKSCVQTQMCIQGYEWDSKSCQCVPSVPPAPSSCKSNADCRTFADYCTGCNCLALSYSDADPTCDGPGVRCFADPCMGQTAVCINGSCSLQ